MILIVYGHPYPSRSIVNNRLLAGISDIDDIEVRPLYNLYPDFDIDVDAEQHALEKADLVILQYPMRWYSCPSLVREWTDQVFTEGWAYGEGGTALQGKTLMWAVTTGGKSDHFDTGTTPGIDALYQPFQATALYCGMHWHAPYTQLGTFGISDAEIDEAVARYRKCIIDWKENNQ
ncbi:Glutathione-regulated potassium-efflux system ancillary protein KefF [Halomonadaceae bacterium LMG 33818]|uniref:glutathione-regulated potassium-efflux system oxidoreductase KefF n=1 Tax=Cernens ardua TaxID=3402176 RepID=UPI003EDBFF41